jgi:23S rRNA G2445 N2-methylase RlmL
VPHRRYELLFLPGLGDFVAGECRSVLGANPAPVPGRDDSVTLEFEGGWARLVAMRTPIAVFAVLTFAVPRPKSLLSGEYLPSIAECVRRVRSASSFRFEAAGAESSVFARLAAELARATGLVHDPESGDVVLRFRRSITVDGWDVLVRISPRPLSDRPWRVRNRPGAVNATIAAAIAIATRPRPSDRVANPMCGSGTLLVERMLAAPVRSATGLEIDADALDACRANLSAAGFAQRAKLVRADVTEPDWTAGGPYDVILADPPWGGLVGEHRTNEALHLALLRRAREAAAPDARVAILTHEIRQMERCLRETAALWRVESVTRVFQKGHHPRIYLLRPA